MLRAFIIDDEPDSIQFLQQQLQQHCPDVEVAASFTYAPKALEALKQKQPDLLFLDIEMPVMNGFQLLEQLGEIKCSIIFVTAYDQFAVKAFRFNALDYLLKPVHTNDLVQAVARVGEKIIPHPTQLRNLKKHLGGEAFSRIAVPDQQGVLFIDVDDIVYAEANNNYTKLLLHSGKQYTLSKTLGNVQEVLEDLHFLRVHRQYIVNLNKVKKFMRGEGMYLIMDNGDNIPVARNQKDKLAAKFGWL